MAHTVSCKLFHVTHKKRIKFCAYFWVMRMVLRVMYSIQHRANGDVTNLMPLQSIKNENGDRRTNKIQTKATEYDNKERR